MLLKWPHTPFMAQEPLASTTRRVHARATCTSRIAGADMAGWQGVATSVTRRRWLQEVTATGGNACLLLLTRLTGSLSQRESLGGRREQPVHSILILMQRSAKKGEIRDQQSETPGSMGTVICCVDGACVIRSRGMQE